MKMDQEIIGITHDRKLPNPGVTGMKFHTFTLLRGVLWRRQPRLEPHRFQKSRALYSLKNRPLDLLVSIAPTDPSSTRFRTSVVLSGELRQSHTWNVTGTIRLPSWHQYRWICVWINDRVTEISVKDNTLMTFHEFLQNTLVPSTNGLWGQHIPLSRINRGSTKIKVQ